MVDTNLNYLNNDLADVARLFYADGFPHMFCRVTLSPPQIFVEAGAEEDGRSFQVYSARREMPYPADELELRRAVKRAAKTALYDALSALTERKLPYGALTGIRPVKLLRQLADEGKPDPEDYMRSYLGVRADKAAMLSDVERAQRQYRNADESFCDLYVGIPFCRGRCSYCSFVSRDIEKTDASTVEAYVSALEAEITHAKELISRRGLTLRSAYFGGGTPSSLSTSHTERLLRAADVPHGTEYTFEAGRPDSITPELLTLLKAFGVTRVSVNPQTLKDETLARIGRRHTTEDFFRAFELAATFGFSVNADLIMGLPGESAEDFEKSLAALCKLSPDCITVHTLCLKNGSYLRERTGRLPAEEAEKMSDFAYPFLSERGYVPYYIYRQKYMAGNLENTGYSLPGRACLYNIDNMEELCSCVACGGGGITKRVSRGGALIQRYASPKDVPTYIAKLSAITEGKDELFER